MVVEVDIGIAKRTTSDSVSAHTNRGNGANLVEHFKQHGFSDEGIEFTDIKRGRGTSSAGLNNSSSSRNGGSSRDSTTSSRGIGNGGIIQASAGGGGERNGGGSSHDVFLNFLNFFGLQREEVGMDMDGWMDGEEDG